MARLISRCVLLVSHNNTSLLRVASADVPRWYSDNSRSSSSAPASMVGRDFLTLKHYNHNELVTLLWTALDLKQRFKHDKEVFHPLAQKFIAMIFQKRSTRTRVSTETGMSLLGGNSLFLSPSDVHLGVSESMKDSARVLSRFTDIMLARVYSHSDVETLALESSVPVINGLSDLYHPLQTLADLITLQEHFKHLQGLRVAWVGDGNNIIHSLMMGGIKMGMDFSVATPKGYECDKNVAQDAANMATQLRTQLKFTNDPREAVENADVIVTDTWISMGQEEEKIKRLKDFAGYQVNQKLLDRAAPGWVFLHCLPRKPEEVSDDVFYSKKSLVWDEAENRRWTVMAVILNLLQEYKPTIPKPSFDGK